MKSLLVLLFWPCAPLEVAQSVENRGLKIATFSGSRGVFFLKGEKNFLFFFANVGKTALCFYGSLKTVRVKRDCTRMYGAFSRILLMVSVAPPLSPALRPATALSGWGGRRRAHPPPALAGASIYTAWGASPREVTPASMENGQ